MTRRIRLIIEYIGTNYVGWQIQPNGVSVQEVVASALSKVTAETIKLHGSGRTDSGVHARAQVAHFDTAARMDASKFAVAANTFLPADIRILYSEEAPEDFHARFSAKQKQYRYALQLGPHARVFQAATTLHIHTMPEFDRMNAAAADCLGMHDFHAFMSAGTTIENTVRTISLSRWTQSNDLLYYDIQGNGFLYNMVRILVGTMLEIGCGKRAVTGIADAILTGNRTDAGATAPAKGLTLMRLWYPDFDTDEVLARL